MKSILLQRGGGEERTTGTLANRRTFEHLKVADAPIYKPITTELVQAAAIKVFNDLLHLPIESLGLLPSTSRLIPS